jgi:hypothetical protein
MSIEPPPVARGDFGKSCIYTTWAAQAHLVKQGISGRCHHRCSLSHGLVGRRAVRGPPRRHDALNRRSRLRLALAHSRSPNFSRKVFCALSQRGRAMASRASPVFVMANIRLLRHPSIPILTRPLSSNGPRFRLRVERSMLRSFAKAVIDTEPSIATAASTASWVARRPTGRSVSS